MERERHSQQFLSCQPTDGFITGTQVEMLSFFSWKWTTAVIERGDRILALYQLQTKGFFMQAGLPPMVLAQVLFRVEVCLVSPGCSQIWGVADMNGDGKMDIHEFSITCKLINLKLKGMELPKVAKNLPNFLIFHLCSVSTATNAWASSSDQPARGDANGKHGDGNARLDL